MAALVNPLSIIVLRHQMFEQWSIEANGESSWQSTVSCYQ